MNNITLYERDLCLYDIEEQIVSRRQLILEKTKEIKKKEKLNHFLQDVASDYKKYYDYIIQERQQQYDSMKTLQVYLDDLMKTEKLASYELKQAKRDQKELLKEMDKIKLELDKLINL